MDVVRRNRRDGDVSLDYEELKIVGHRFTRLGKEKAASGHAYQEMTKHVIVSGATQEALHAIYIFLSSDCGIMFPRESKMCIQGRRGEEPKSHLLLTLCSSHHAFSTTPSIREQLSALNGWPATCGQHQSGRLRKRPRLLH